MTESTPTRRDFAVDYIEFLAPDVPEAKQFYTAAFGWSFEDWGPEYASFQQEKIGGGFTTEAPTRSGAPLVILYAADLQGALGRVQKAGGTVVKPIFSFPGGRRFHFTDPSGNELAIWSDH